MMNKLIIIGLVALLFLTGGIGIILNQVNQVSEVDGSIANSFFLESMNKADQEKETLQNKIIELESELNILKEDEKYDFKKSEEQKDLSSNRMDALLECYWAFSFLEDPQGSYEHFDEDFTEYYSYGCNDVWYEWEYLIDGVIE